MIHPSLSKTLHDLLGAPHKTGEVGIEIELEGNNLPTEVEGWSVKEENSLRGEKGRVVEAGSDAPDMPREYVSARPVLFKSLLNKLIDLKAALDKKGVKYKLCDRASTHVHLNFGNKTLHDLLGFCLVFVAVEPVLLRMCGQTRNGNLFCMPCYETGDMPLLLENMVVGLKKNNLRDYFGRGRYAALNLDSLRTLGSVEIRCFPNEVDPTTINRWVAMLINIRDTGADADASFTGLMDRMINDHKWLLRQVFGLADTVTPCYPETPEALIGYGVEHAYECWRAMKPLFEWKEEKKVEEIYKKPKNEYNFIELDDDGPGMFDAHNEWQRIARAAREATPAAPVGMLRRRGGF